MSDELPTSDEIIEKLKKAGFKHQYYGGVQIGFANRPYSPAAYRKRSVIERMVREDVADRLFKTGLYTMEHCQVVARSARLYGIHVNPFEVEEWDPCELSEIKLGWCPMCTYVWAILSIRDISSRGG